MKRTISNTLVVIASTIGTSFVSGIEAITFVGNNANAWLFAIVFATTFLCICKAMKQLKLSCIDDISTIKFGKEIQTLLVMCCYVVVICVLAGVTGAVSQVIGESSLPFGVYFVGLCSIVIMASDDKKIFGYMCNTQLILVIILVVTTLISNKGTTTSLSISPIKAIVYALFSATMLIGVATKFDLSATTIICSGTLLTLLIIAIISVYNGSPFPLCKQETFFGKVLLIVTLFVSGTTTVVSSSVVVMDKLKLLTNDKMFSACVIVTSALFFSLFDLTILLNTIYTFVAIVGVLFVVVMIINIVLQKNRHIN